MTEVLLALGSYRFSLDTAAHERLRRTTQYRWASQERLGQAPALQYVGPGSEEITLEGRIYPHHRGGLGQVDALRREATLGRALLLVDGTGQVWGRFVVAQVEETQTVFWSDGRPRRVDFDVRLQRYGGEA